MKRCHLCKGYILPWQRAYWNRTGFTQQDKRHTLYWHKGCRAAFDRILQEDADAWEEGQR